MSLERLKWTEVHIVGEYELTCAGVFDEPVDPAEILGTEFVVNIYGEDVIVVITDILDWRKWMAIDRKRARRQP